MGGFIAPDAILPKGPGFRKANRYTLIRGKGQIDPLPPIISRVLVSDFSFHLPEELIAQEPLADRSASRMLHLRRNSGAFEDSQFRCFPDLLRSDDLLVVNNSRVFPAR